MVDGLSLLERPVVKVKSWPKTKVKAVPLASLIPAMDGLNGIVKMLILTQWGSPASQEDDCEAFCDLFQAQARRTSAPFSLPLVRKVASLFWSHISRVMLFRKRSSEQIPLILSKVVIGVQCHRQWLQNSLDESPLNLAIAMWSGLFSINETDWNDSADTAL